MYPRQDSLIGVRLMLEGKKEAVPDFRFNFQTLIRRFYPFFYLKSENSFLLSFLGMVKTAELLVAALGLKHGIANNQPSSFREESNGRRPQVPSQPFVSNLFQ